jgi:mRNA interferase RelE/StbE
VYRVELTTRARRELDAVPAGDFERIDRAILRLRENPRLPGVRKLRGSIYRLRVGRWRIIYAVLDREQVVVVGKIARRAEDTYDELEELF